MREKSNLTPCLFVLDLRIELPLIEMVKIAKEVGFRRPSAHICLRD